MTDLVKCSTCVKRKPIQFQHHLYRKVPLPDGRIIFQHVVSGGVMAERPSPPCPVPGGILAEEMGLGKTVEVLALLLCRPRPTIKKEEGDEDEVFVGLSSTGLKAVRRSSSPSEFFLNCKKDDTDTCQEESPTVVSSVGETSVSQVDDPSEDHSNTHSPKKDCSPSKNKKGRKRRRTSQEREKLDPISDIIEFTIAKYCHDGNRSKLSSNKKKPPGTLYERMKVQYEKTLSEWSALGALQKKPVIPRTTFVCSCGGVEIDPLKGASVRCGSCGQSQHAICMRYTSNGGLYLCPQCQAARPPLPSKATLVVSPTSISRQWIREIHKCVRNHSLRILYYRGVSLQGYMPPMQLAKYDIVVTTYETLKRDLNYEELSGDGEKSFRQQKRFLVVRSPLVSVEWWRLCLDEAQLAEGTTSRAAGMALRLHAVNRWCVTGTPMQKALVDLQGLLLFLRAPALPPLQHSQGELAHHCYKRLAEFLAPFLWRSSKKDVLHQIGVPDQTEELHWLHFSPVEEYFYRRQHKQCATELLLKLKLFSSTQIFLKKMNRQVLSRLLQPLLNLRQACCHPQMVRGCMLNMKKSQVSMEELLESLVQRTKTEAEEAHRQMVAALNGIAGIHILKGNFLKAVEAYREVLQSVRERNGQVKTDSLQLLHTLHNLADILKDGHPGIPPTLRDDGLQEEANQLRETYLRRSRDGVATAGEAVIPCTKQVNELQLTTWWADVLEWAVESSYRDEDLVVRVREALEEGLPKNQVSVASQFTTCRGMQITLDRLLEKLETQRQMMLEAMENFSSVPSSEIVEQAVLCHLRPDSMESKKGKKGGNKKCLACKTHQHFDQLELVLFRVHDTRVDHEQVETVQMLGELRRGSWADGEAQRMLRVLLSVARNHSRLKDVLESGNNHLKRLEAMKKEFRLLRILWRHLNDQISSQDEVEMATLRLRLTLPWEEEAEEEEASRWQQGKAPGGRSTNIRTYLSSCQNNPLHRIHILRPHEVDSQQARLASDKVVASSQLRQKLGQLSYLLQLQAQSYGKKGALNPEPCPICQLTLGEQWSVLLCGHCFCNGCLRVLLTEYGCGFAKRSVRCAICRQITHHSDVSYVHAAPEGEQGDEEELDQVKGSYSTKVEAVVRTLLRLHRTEPESKSLVFCSWERVLEVLEKALVENKILYRHLTKGRQSFEDGLKDFRNLEDVRVLLLPYRSGANGLNLVEATHVLLVEPILNPAEHAQAVGRVHRIGQTKSTVVHRFMVRNTVEEKIYDILEAHQGPEDKGLTLEDLKQLFSSQEAEEATNSDWNTRRNEGESFSAESSVFESADEEAGGMEGNESGTE